MTPGDILRACADGREEYRQGASDPVRGILRAEANALRLAAMIADGDLGPAYGLIPSWRWVEIGLDDPRPGVTP